MALQRLAVVGTGLIGASVGLAARDAGVEDVRGWDVDERALSLADDRGAVAAVESLEGAGGGTEVVGGAGGEERALSVADDGGAVAAVESLEAAVEGTELVVVAAPVAALPAQVAA